MRDKAELINTIIKHKGYKTYLELGVGPHIETITQIVCDSISSVDILKVNEKFPSFVGTTDDFFKQNNQKFDVIYIDADHEENAVQRDFENSLKCLTENGIILMHDVGPMTESGTALTAHGTVYKTFIKIRNDDRYDSFSYEFKDNGDVLGFVKVSKNSDKLELPSVIDYNYYNTNKNSILKRKSLEEILTLI